jgi:hypothetical protein
MPTPKEMIESYLQGPKLLREVVAGMSRAQLVAKPIAGKWSSLQCVCHLADFDPILADRMKRVIAEDKPSLIGADENHFAAALAYDDRDVDEELTIIDKTRQQMSRILRKIPAEAWTRVGLHNERGPLTLEQLLASATKHIPHHVKFIHEKRQALGLK